MNRNPAVAGRFYESDPDALQEQVRRHIDAGKPREKVLGVVAPHAGFLYSGDVAGSVYGRIVIPPTVILIGPNHTGSGKPVSLMIRGAWSMPMGEVEIDTELAESILEQLPESREDEKAHRQEHSLETQLPFLQYFRKDLKIVPVCLMRVSLEECQRLGNAILRTLKKLNRRVLIVASSDMTHYEPHSIATEKDKLALDKILKLDPAGLYETVRDEKISMCGVHPVTVMLHCCNQLGATEATLVKYRTSGEVNGDMEYVVGYAGVIVQ